MKLIWGGGGEVLVSRKYRFSNYDEAGGFGKKSLSLSFIFNEVVN